MADARAAPGMPGFGEVMLETFGCEVAEKLQCCTAFEHALPFGQKALKFKGLHLGAILFPLQAALRLFVVVELPLGTGQRAMEQIDRAPKQFVKFGFKSGIAQRGDQCVDDICDGSGDLVALRQRAGIGFILEWTPAVKLEFGEDVVGW
ncbi:hypothetical protein NBRC116593_23100 [Sulfitobacter pacificus]